MAIGRRMQFPEPTEVTDENPVAWRSSQDLVKIANEANGWTYKNLCPTITDWVKVQASSVGWSNVHFPLAYPSRTLRAGAVFEK